MLALTRKADEGVVIKLVDETTGEYHRVLVRILSVTGQRVKLGFISSDPEKVIIFREESDKDSL